MSDLLFWMADNLDVWRYWAIAGLAAVAIGFLRFAVEALDEMTR